ncbi:MAG TPA: glycine betaine ABC transporter substrate-binding protein [Actinomycetota bacterium]|nr:glycine betaine ABC transporter substrate-binding protein [Actinomycetota bacterium]
MRSFRSSAHGAILIALTLVLAACGSGVGDDNGDSGDEGNGGGEPIASQMVLGGPPECPDRPFCLPGLEETYGLEFESFQPLDVGGPQTINALTNGRIDVGLVFSTSSAIVANDLVVLEDDQGLQQAENITPIVREEALDDTIEASLDAVSAALTTENITELNGFVEIDGQDPSDVAADFIESEGIAPEGSGSGDLTVGGVSFAENQIVAEMYAQVLEEAGYSVDRQIDLRSREILYPAIESGEVDIAPEYVGTLVLFLDPEAEGGSDPEAIRSELEPLLQEDGIALLESSEANDTNAFAVTSETADEFGISSLSDLADPAE